MDDLIEGLMILKKYMSGYALKYPTHCEHDTLLIACRNKDINTEDAARLDELGFHWSDEFDCWASFKFGSN